MIRISTSEPKRRRLVLAIPVVLSLMAHAGFVVVTSEISARPHEPERISRIEFRAPPPPQKRIEPEPTPPEPKPEPTPEDPPEPKVRRPKPNKSAPPPSEPDAPPKKPVFGATAESVQGSDSSVAIRVGNTLGVEMEREYTPPQNIEPLPAASPLPEAHIPPSAPKPVPVYTLTTAPSFRERVEPSYPDEARRAGVEGTVQLEILIDEKGRVRKVKVLNRIGFGLEKAAVAAVTQSRFNPGVVGNRPVPVKIKVPYKFVLDT